jgi:predicted DNA-binding transcriptional regulator YafY
MPVAERRGRGRVKAAAPDQRMLELLLLLLGADGPLSRAEIFAAIPAYRTAKPAAGERKFERDKKDLRELGVPLDETEPGSNVYRVDRRAYALPPVTFDEEERAALLLAAEAARGAQGLPYRELIDEGLRKLSFIRPLAAGELPPGLAVAAPERRRGRGQRKVLEGLTRAAETRKRVRLTYATETGELTERSLDPYAVVHRAGEWLVVGYCHLRQAQRTFRIDRVRAIGVGQRPGTPDFEPPADFDLARYLRRSPWVFQAGVSGFVDVVLDVGPDRGWMADEDFGDQAVREPLAGGWVRVRFRSGNPEYVVTRVLDGAGHLRLVAPTELRQRVLDVCQQAIARAGGGIS